jgi:macrolide transport system ATP-binding/permease protein
MNAFFQKLSWQFRRRGKEDDLSEEIRFHLEEEAEQLQAGGIESDRAAWAARRDFGNVTLLKEDTRAMWTWTLLEQFMQDVRYGLRAMAGNKLFTSMAVLSLALGIGANTAIYSFMDAIMLRALPVSHPGELVILNWRAKADPPIVQDLWGSDYDEPGGGTTSPNYPYQAFELLRDNNRVLSSLFGHAGAGRLNLVIDGQAELDSGQYVTGNYFSGLGVPPAAGRLIGRDDDRAGAAPIAVITYDYWRARFGANPAIVGKAIQINGAAFTIAGVCAPEFFGVSPGDKPSIFLPIADMGLTDSRFDWPKPLHEGTFYWIEVMGRLKPGVTLQQAQTQLAGMFHGFVESTVTKDRERKNLPALWLQEGGSGFDSLRRTYSKTLWVLMAMVALILVIACANIANLLLARAAARRREMAVRLSLGAGRLRLARQLLTESVMLALMGGLCGIGVAALGIRFLALLLTEGDDGVAVAAGIDWRVLLFTLAIALATGLLFGLAPAIQATKTDVTPALKETRSSVVRVRRRRFGLRFGLSHILVISQIAISLLLVVGAGLFVRSLAKLHSVSLGFNSENILLFNLDAGKAGYKGPASKNFYADLRQRFLSIPGVRAATLSNLPLVSDWTDSTGVGIPGVPKPPEGKRGPATAYAQVGPAFFETMQIPILLGRPINEQDVEGAKSVAVVNEVFAKKYFPTVNPIGRHFTFGGSKNEVDLEIVGVAKNARYNSLKREIPPVTYTSYLQESNTVPTHDMFFELRTAGDPLALSNAARQVVHVAGPQVPVGDITTQARRIEGTIVQERTFASLCTCFGALALIMACVGLYGSMAYAVARRTSEIGIRMALGAVRRRIIWMVLREVLVLAAFGLLIGFAGAWETTAFIKSFLFGLQPNDPLALSFSVAILIACALLAGYAPAWRASRIDPMTALRHE